MAGHGGSPHYVPRLREHPPINSRPHNQSADRGSDPGFATGAPNTSVGVAHVPRSRALSDPLLWPSAVLQVHMGCLVKVSGVVTRRSPVFPQLKACKFTCISCGYVLGPFAINGEEPAMRGVPCPSCQAKGPYILNAEQTVYCNYQKASCTQPSIEDLLTCECNCYPRPSDHSPGSPCFSAPRPASAT